MDNPPDEAAAANQDVSKRTTRECPICAETIQRKAVVCRFCGVVFEDAPEHLRDAYRAKTGLIDAAVGENPVSVEAPGRDKAIARWVATLVGVAIVSLAVVGVAAYAHHSQTVEKREETRRYASQLEDVFAEYEASRDEAADDPDSTIEDVFFIIALSADDAAKKLDDINPPAEHARLHARLITAMRSVRDVNRDVVLGHITIQEAAKRGPGLEDVSSELRQAGLPSPNDESTSWSTRFKRRLR